MQPDFSKVEVPVDQDLFLREIAFTDAAPVFRIIDNNRTYLREWLPFVDFTREVADTEAYVLTVSAEANFSDMVFVVMYKEQHAGIIGFKGIDLINMKLEIGYWLAEAQQNKGIMIRCCNALLKYAFEQLNMNRVQLKVAIGNTRSKKIPAKLGFIKEGIERDGELGSSGEFHDLEVYSLLKRDWKK